jgi:hypothetical protein
MAAVPNPLLRQVPIELLCSLGWVYGTLHVPAHQTIYECLALSGPSVKLTRVRVSREPDPLSFLALRRQDIAVIAPPAGEPLWGASSYGPTRNCEIACFLTDHTLRGRVEVPVGLRLSDFLRQEGTLLALRHGMLAPSGATLQSPGAKTLDLALVDLNHVIGVAETG